MSGYPATAAPRYQHAARSRWDRWRYFRTLAQMHNTDEARRAVAEIIVEQIEHSNFTITEGQVRQNPPGRDGANILRARPSADHQPEAMQTPSLLSGAESKTNETTVTERRRNLGRSDCR